MKRLSYEKRRLDPLGRISRGGLASNLIKIQTELSVADCGDRYVRRERGASSGG